MVPSFRYLVVAYLTFPLIAAATIFIAFLLLGELGFSTDRAKIGCLGLLFATTFLPYAQNQEENSLIFLMAITGVYLLFRWLATDSTLALVLGTICFGFNILIRHHDRLRHFLSVAFFPHVACLTRERIGQGRCRAGAAHAAFHRRIGAGLRDFRRT